MPRVDSVFILKGRLNFDVVSCEKMPYRNGWVFKVVFANGKSFNYSLSDVREYVLLGTFKGQFRVRDNDGVNIETVIHVYGERGAKPVKGNVRVFGIEQRNGFIRYRLAGECDVTSGVGSKDLRLFNYLRDQAWLSVMTSEDCEDALSLGQRYDSQDTVYKDSALWKYLNPDEKRSMPKTNEVLIFPFGCNEGQYDAVDKALREQLSVIQGPPGTGKTQTILNIVANLVIRGKSVEVVSNNNAAVENVFDKLRGKELDFFVAPLGRKINKERFFQSQSGILPDLSAWRLPDGISSEIRIQLQDTSRDLLRYFSSCEKKARIEELIYELESQYHSEFGDAVIPRKRRFGSSRSAYSYLFFLERRQDSLWLRFSLRARLQAFRLGFGFRIPDRRSIEAVAVSLRLGELRMELSELSSFIDSFKPKYDGFVVASMAYFKDFLAKRFSDGERRVWKSEELFSPAAGAFLKDYPVVLSTTFSATSNIFRSISFDCLIMDEASQVDVPSGALALACSHSAVIVGDDRQLPNVMTGKDMIRSDEVYASYGDIPEGYRVSRNSFLSSVQKVLPSVPVTLLKEHYRCEPRIIGFCNKQFYGGQLIAMTRRSDKPSMKVISTVLGNHARGHSNRRQAEEAVAEVKTLLEDYSSVGVIVPYNEQAKLIAGLLQKENISGIPVSTVHKFQGREEDAIVLCTVDNEIRDFVDDPHMLNVAVSRAKKHFTLIVNGGEIPDGNIHSLFDYIRLEGEGEQKTGKIRSVFDILYFQYAEERKIAFGSGRISSFDSENIMFGLLSEILQEDKYQRFGFVFQYPLGSLIAGGVELEDEERIYAMRSWTALDFLVFDRVTRNPFFAMEVDGTSFHKAGSKQKHRDELKDSVLGKLGIRCLRLSTDGSSEREIIVSVLDEFCR